MSGGFLFNIFIFLSAACLVVPLAGRFRLGSVLGYLAAGITIGPFGLKLIANSVEILHFAEFGVVMMLFLIGLELEPARLWKLRKSIVGLGSLQVIITSIALASLGVMLGYDWRLSFACGIAMSLSSTALVLQMMEEKGLMKTSSGELSFSVLLFQDIALVPILILMPLLAINPPLPINKDWLSHLPGFLHALIIMGVILVLIIFGHYFSRHLFHFIAKTNLRELFTAISLALIVGITLLMQKVGVSPALGAFIAGVVLANSEYKHTIETDIEPFKGLLLGLFFISVGMGIDFELFQSQPLTIITAVVGLIIIKMIILYILGYYFGLSGPQNALFTVALAQGGEFAFVLFRYIANLQIIDVNQADLLTLIVALSMATTPFLMLLNDRFILTKFVTMLSARNYKYDTIEQNDNPVIIAGYGRFGQIIGRFMTAQGVKVTILEKDPDQIDLLRRFGNKVYFGDASRLDLLKSAGASKAKILIVAIDDADKALEIVRLSKKEFPNLKVFARARNRRHAYELHKAAVDYFRRETFDSSLMMAGEAMKILGANEKDVYEKAKKFTKHDNEMLETSFAFFEEEQELINFAKNTRNEFERILQNDIKDDSDAKIK